MPAFTDRLFSRQIGLPMPNHTKSAPTGFEPACSLAGDTFPIGHKAHQHTAVGLGPTLLELETNVLTITPSGYKLNDLPKHRSSIHFFGVTDLTSGDRSEITITHPP